MRRWWRRYRHRERWMRSRGSGLGTMRDLSRGHSSSALEFGFVTYLVTGYLRPAHRCFNRSHARFGHQCTGRSN